MSNYVALYTLTAEQVEQRTEKLSTRVSNTQHQVVYQAIINSRHIIKWFENEENVYYYRIGGRLKCIGKASCYTQYIELIVAYFTAKEK